MPTGWWDLVRDTYLLECTLKAEKPDPEWIRDWEAGRTPS